MPRTEIQRIGTAWLLSRCIYAIEQYMAPRFDIFYFGENLIFGDANAKMVLKNDDASYTEKPFINLLNEMKHITDSATGEFNESNKRVIDTLLNDDYVKTLFVRRIYSNGCRSCILVLDNIGDDGKVAQMDGESDGEATSWFITRGSDKVTDLLACLNTSSGFMPPAIADEIVANNPGNPNCINIEYHNGLIQYLNYRDPHGVPGGVLTNVVDHAIKLLGENKCYCGDDVTSCPTCNNKEKHHVIFAGHSLGGGVSELLATNTLMRIGKRTPCINGSQVSMIPFCGFKTLTARPANYMRTYNDYISETSGITFNHIPVRNSADIIGAESWMRLFGSSLPLFGDYKPISKTGYCIQGGGLLNGQGGPYSIHSDTPYDIGAYVHLPIVFVNAHLMNYLNINNDILIPFGKGQVCNINHASCTDDDEEEPSST
jgi:hypothetical protein